MSDDESGKGSPTIDYRPKIQQQHPKILDNDKNTKLHYLVSKGNEETILQYLGKEFPMIDSENYMGWTPLMMACRNGYISTTKILLEHHANATKVNRYGMNIFHLAVVSGKLELVKLILNHLLMGGISRRNLEKLFSTISLAILFRHQDILRFLVSQHFQIDLATKITGITPLMFAQAIDNTAAIKFLLQNKAETETKNFLGHTAVDIAVIRQKIKCINPNQNIMVSESLVQPITKPVTTRMPIQPITNTIQGKDPEPPPPVITHPNLPSSQSPFIAVTPTEYINTPLAYITFPNHAFNTRKSSNVSPMEMPLPPPITPVTPLTISFPRQVFFPPDFSPCQVAYTLADCYNNDLLNTRINTSPGMFFSPPILHVLSPRI
ncbi:uncharacterized protein LOC143203129 [Rhynchophorus ferrugineus]|uniref:uncharacterized protein LOC143203129 n=1 Tax=Rhynchophorus ferrugineus TaxID=354439 RepID=UPI003FCEC5C0